MSVLFKNAASHSTELMEARNNYSLGKLEKKVFLATATMHGDELKYIKEAYDTNWMTTVGKNIDEVERISAEKLGCGYAVGLSSGTAALHMAVKLAGEELYGKPKVGHGALEGRKAFCTDMTFDASVNPIVYEELLRYIPRLSLSCWQTFTAHPQSYVR